MTILDVTGLSGFTPNIDDLDKLKNNVDKFIDNYEWANGHLIIYLESVSYLRRECIAFRMIQEVSVVTLQPAAVSVFEYYAPERHCTTFYHPTTSLLSLPRLCEDTTCKCAAGQCPTMKPYMDSSITVDERMQALCDGPTLHFDKDQSAQAGAVRKLIVPEYCWKTYPQIKKFYLVMGQDGSINDEQGRMQYVLNGRSWMELWPAAGHCTQSDTHKKFCQDLETFSVDFQAEGCQT
uniref:Alpha-macroglobulin receptor-binding domain-containing protein n=1 Tax=Eptatretus burgeri TaxID=7764 RepID=A0A8C4WZQ8_EPTBU